MKAQPAEYAEEKLGVICTYPVSNQLYQIDYGSIRNITNPGKG